MPIAIELTKKFGYFAFGEAISAAKKELELWKELKKGLLQQMFV